MIWAVCHRMYSWQKPPQPTDNEAYKELGKCPVILPEQTVAFQHNVMPFLAWATTRDGAQPMAEWIHGTVDGGGSQLKGINNTSAYSQRAAGWG